jgi:hypothetical protein
VLLSFLNTFLHLWFLLPLAAGQKGKGDPKTKPTVTLRQKQRQKKPKKNYVT